MDAAVIGGGSWGSAFALHLGHLGRTTLLWVRESEVYGQLREKRRNDLFLPGFQFPPEVSFSNDILEAASSAPILFVAVPSRFCRQVFENFAPALKSNQVVVSLTKGIEEGSLKTMTEVMAEVFSGSALPRLAVLSGPSFAREVAERLPTAVVVASVNTEAARFIQRFISNIHFRPYTSGDVIGVELAGAMKNVIAVAAGISDALRFGHNPRAALITRGIAEMTRLGLSCGAQKETFLGLAGIGDLVLTCTAQQSRNYHLGYELGRGRRLADIQAESKMIAEGITTTLSVRALAGRERVEMPICAEVFRVLYEDKNPEESLRDLMLRTLKVE